jgi:hypothetical protein
MPQQEEHMSILDRLIPAAAILCLAACVAGPAPNPKIAVAQASVQRAEQANAQQLAPVELSAAQNKLARAEQEAAKRDPKPATELAEQANVDAQLAEAVAQEHRSHQAAVELDASLQALRQESTHSAPPPPPAAPTPQPEPPTE